MSQFGEVQKLTQQMTYVEQLSTSSTESRTFSQAFKSGVKNCFNFKAH